MPLSNPSVFRPIRSGVANPTSVASSIVSVTLLAANSNRLGAIIWNNSASDLYVDLDAEASASNFAVKVAADGGYYELPFAYTGVVSGIWDTADGNAMVREFLP